MADDRPVYELPSNGAHPGSPQMLAGRAGPFHAVLTRGGAEAWLGRSRPRHRTTWPADWSVRFDPIELISPDGEVFAVEGQVLVAGGGYGSTDDEWLIQSLSRDDPFIKRVARLQARRDGTAEPEKS